jgi:ABC-type phosphate/phosphonate transport system substrate-binding protein
MIANARMYAVNATAQGAWRTLLAWVLDRAQVPADIVDHDAPAPMRALWSRDDLGCALMCGLPYALREPAPQLVAAPIPSPPRYGGRPVYMTDIVVRADSPARTIADTFGGRIGYTVEDSQSGYFALRRFLALQRTADEPLYAAAVGGLLNARGVIDALVAGRIDLGPLDSYSHDLIRHLEPDTARRVRVVATTAPTAIPAFVATAQLSGEALARLRGAFVEAGAAGELASARATLLLRGFAVPAPEDYRPLRAHHDALVARAEPW